MTVVLDPKTLTYNYIYEPNHDCNITDPWEIDPTQIEFAQSVLSYAAYLGQQWGADVEARYLEFQANRIVKPPREQTQVMLKRSLETLSKIDLALFEVLHPLCVPKRIEDIALLLGDRGIRIGIQRLKKLLGAMVEAGELKKRPNPWRGNTWVYSHAEWNATPQVGDKVVQLTRRHQKKGVYGTVLRWEQERATKRVAPVVQFDRHYGKTTEFADPSSLIIVDRPIKEDIKINNFRLVAMPIKSANKTI